MEESNFFIEAVKWFFGLRLDAPFLEWLDTNKVVLATLLGLPILALKRYYQFREDAQMLREAFEDPEMDVDDVAVHTVAAEAEDEEK